MSPVFTGIARELIAHQNSDTMVSIAQFRGVSQEPELGSTSRSGRSPRCEPRECWLCDAKTLALVRGVSLSALGGQSASNRREKFNRP